MRKHCKQLLSAWACTSGSAFESRCGSVGICIGEANVFDLSKFTQ
jgi:hypothetical protein